MPTPKPFSQQQIAAVKIFNEYGRGFFWDLLSEDLLSTRWTGTPSTSRATEKLTDCLIELLFPGQKNIYLDWLE